MPHFANVVAYSALALSLATWVGLPIARRMVANRTLAIAFAPASGWAAFSALALPILGWVGFTPLAVSAVALAAVVTATVALYRRQSLEPTGASEAASIPVWQFALAALLAVGPAIAIWPKFANGGVVLAAPMFDHSKIAIIDDIIRLGLPPGNPVFGEASSGSGLAYYYLWHFSAAAFAKVAGASGWEADIGLTWFTAFASLSLMMGLAVWISGRSLAALLVLVLSTAGSLRPILFFLLNPGLLGRMFSQDEPPHAWLYQASWGPQHLASACCVVLAIVLLYRIATSTGWSLVPVLAVIVAAGFESSTWVGGVIFPAAALAFGAILCLQGYIGKGADNFPAKAASAAILALLIVTPFLRAEAAAMAARQIAFPIAFRPFEVIGAILPDHVRHILDLPAYWLVLLMIELPAIWIAGIAALIAKPAGPHAFAFDRRLTGGLAALAVASFAIPWLFVSTVANNDLGWRGVLPGILTLTSFAAAGLSQWLATTRRGAIAAIACIALGFPGGLQLIQENVVGLWVPTAAQLAESQDLWAAVRQQAAPRERVANNPLFLADSLYWPVNISWALFADRRSCYGGWELARAFVPLPVSTLQQLDELFERIFSGHGTPEDVRELAVRYECRVVVIAASDGAWSRDPFASSPFYRLADQRDGRWRIYRAVTNDGVRQ